MSNPEIETGQMYSSFGPDDLKTRIARGVTRYGSGAPESKTEIQLAIENAMAKRVEVAESLPDNCWRCGAPWNKDLCKCEYCGGWS